MAWRGQQAGADMQFERAGITCGGIGLQQAFIHPGIEPAGDAQTVRHGNGLGQDCG
jgi:hypothetical protein